MLRRYRLGVLAARSLYQHGRSSVLSHRLRQLTTSTTALPHSASSICWDKPPTLRPLLVPRALYSTVVVQNTRRASRLPRALWFALLSLGAFTVTFFYGLDHFFPFLPPFTMGSLPTDEETLALYKPQDEVTREIDEFIKNHPLVQKLRADSRYTESRPHLQFPDEIRGHSLTAGTLLGENKIVVPPLFFNDTTAHELVSVFYLGTDVSGHPGIVHGGLLATLLDEGLAHCCFPALPNKIAVTAMLNMEYKKPAPTGSFFVLRAKTTKVEGRKAWVEGHIEPLVGEGEEPEVLVGAKALFIEPRGAKAFSTLYKVA